MLFVGSSPSIMQIFVKDGVPAGHSGTPDFRPLDAGGELHTILPDGLQTCSGYYLKK